MPADLETIVAAARSLIGIEFTSHYLHDRQSTLERPWASEIIFRLAHGDPRIVSDDLGQEDARGAVCSIECRAPDGTAVIVRLNYERSRCES